MPLNKLPPKMVHPQLVLARQFFDEARVSPQAETPYVRMKRIHHLDVCVETALNVIVNHHGTPEEQGKHGVKKPLSWHELWDLADTISKRTTQKSLPGRSELKTLHESRNLAHHSGAVPGVETISRGAEPTRAILDFVCREFYGAEFERLQEWHVLQCAELRDWIDECAEAVDRSMNIVAVAGARFAYDSMVQAVRREAAGDLLHLQRGLPVGMERFQDALSALQEALTMMESGIIAVGLGMSFASHYRFMRICRSLYPNPLLPSRYPLLDRPQLVQVRSIPDDMGEFTVHYIGKAATYLESAYPLVFADLQMGRKLRDAPLWKHYATRDAQT